MSDVASDASGDRDGVAPGGARPRRGPMNDDYRELKARLRRLDEVLAVRGVQHAMELAQAVSRVHRAERRGDRSREPNQELRTLLERAEAVANKGA